MARNRIGGFLHVGTIGRPYGFGLLATVSMMGLGAMCGTAAATPAAPTAPITAINPAQTTPQLPRLVGPIPVTPSSRAYLGNPAVVDAAGYVEEEYFLEGTASTYDWIGISRDVRAVAGPSPYATRILVRRPRDAKRFSGRVEVTVLNASTGVDQGGPTNFARMVKDGDAWIGITSKALTAKALKRFDPVRYAPLDWSNPAPEGARCAQPTIVPVYTIGGQQILDLMSRMGMEGSTPANEDGLVYDMLAQLARLLKSDARGQVLPGAMVPRLYLTGVSQSSLLIRTWVTAFHDRYRTPAGKPLYDGYLAVVGPAMLRLNQCGPDVLAQDPRQKLVPGDVPFISLSSEGESWLFRHTRQPDAFTRHGGIVSYEVTGASHPRAEVPTIAPDPLRIASAADQAKAGFVSPTGSAPSRMIPAGYSANAMPWAPIVRGAYRNLLAWAENGRKPPAAPAMALDDKLEIHRDAHGNGLGGLRQPYVAVPTAVHRGAVSVGGPGAIFGIQKPFSPEELKALYPTHAAYVARFAAATDRLLEQGFILPEDAAAMKQDAAKSTVPDAPVSPPANSASGPASGSTSGQH